jgi:hypothetical protein
MMKWSLGQTIFFAIFGTFGSYITNLRGTFVENVKKVEINPPYCGATVGKASKSRKSGFQKPRGN